MAIRVTVNYEKSFLSPLSLENTFAYFSDCEKTIPENFPGVEVFAPKGNDTYQWVFEKVGYSGYELQIKLLTQFKEKPFESIQVTSVPEPGACSFDGGWTFFPEGDKARVHFKANIEVELPVPGFLKGMATPLAQKELTKLFDRYIARVEKNLR